MDETQNEKVEGNLSAKEAYELKKKEREQTKEKEQNKNQLKKSSGKITKYVYTALVVAVLGLGLYYLVVRSTPDSRDFSRAVPLLDAVHIPEDSPLPEYNSNPPSSGDHFEQTARSGFREKALPDQNIIHNLEHGDVWIAFHPRIDESLKKELEPFGAAKVIVTPREANETDIALVAWGRIDTFNLENGVIPTERIKDFIKRYQNKGPERVPGMSGGI